MRPVAITGVGVLSALGTGRAAHVQALREGRMGLRPLTLLDLSAIAPPPMGQVETLPHVTGARTVDLALAAAGQALLDPAPAQDPGGVLCVGTTTGGMLESESHYLKHRGAPGAEDRELLRHHSLGTVADVLAARLNLGPALERQTFSTACSSSANAIGYGAMRVAQGAPWALVGGVDSLTRLTAMGFHALRLLSRAGCRPFDRRRQGMSLGEGAAFLLLESETRARARGAPVLGFVAGWGSTSDAHHMTSPHPDGAGALAAMQAALRDAELEPGEVDYVNAHGTATVANDRAEASALHRLFGDDGPPVSSTKGATGHTLAAAGALEAALSLFSLQEGFLPATVGLEEPDPELRVRHVAPGDAPGRLLHALSNSLGFGGNNTSLILRGPA